MIDLSERSFEISKELSCVMVNVKYYSNHYGLHEGYKYNAS